MRWAGEAAAHRVWQHGMAGWGDWGLVVGGDRSVARALWLSYRSHTEQELELLGAVGDSVGREWGDSAPMMSRSGSGMTWVTSLSSTSSNEEERGGDRRGGSSKQESGAVRGGVWRLEACDYGSGGARGKDIEMRSTLKRVLQKFCSPVHLTLLSFPFQAPSPPLALLLPPT